MRAAAIAAFQKQADALGAQLAPVTLVLPDGTTILTAYSSGSVPRELFQPDGNGIVIEQMQHFRVPKADLPAPPAVGTLLRRKVTGEPDLLFRLHEVPDRPTESSHLLLCHRAHQVTPPEVDTFLLDPDAPDTFELDAATPDSFQLAA